MFALLLVSLKMILYSQNVVENVSKDVQLAKLLSTYVQLVDPVFIFSSQIQYLSPTSDPVSKLALIISSPMLL
jgi:hypothetical protein